MSAFAPHYNTLVCSHTEYALQACSSNLVANADCLEQIQRLATMLIKGFRRLPYEERLSRLGLHSLNRRRPQIFFQRRQPSLFLFCKCGLACEVMFSKFCRVLVGAFEKGRPFQHESWIFGAGSPPLIHNPTNVEIVLYRITLPIWGYGGPFSPTIPLNIISLLMCYIYCGHHSVLQATDGMK